MKATLVQHLKASGKLERTEAFNLNTNGKQTPRSEVVHNVLGKKLTISGEHETNNDVCQ